MPEHYNRDGVVELCNRFLHERARKRAIAVHHELIQRGLSAAADKDSDGAEPGLASGAVAYPLSRSVSTAFTYAFDELAELAEHLLRDTAEPQLLTQDDVESLIRTHLRVPVEQFDSAYEMMVGAILYEIAVPRSSAPFPIGHLPSRFPADEAAGFEPASVGERDRDVLWSQNGIHLRLAGTALATVDPSTGATPSPYIGEHLVYADVSGCASVAAIAASAARLRRAAPSIFASAYWVHDRKPLVVVSRTPLPFLSEEAYESEADFIHECFDMLFVAGKPKGLVGRMHNAVALLVEADAQTEDFLRIALCITAIEALLGRNTGELSALLADAVAVLLEPELQYRAAAAEYMKNLYGVRSRILHGSQVQGGKRERDSARCIAACALKAVMVRRSFMRKAGMDAESSDALLNELRTLRFASGPPVGVTLTPAAKLWRQSQGTAPPPSETLQ